MVLQALAPIRLLDIRLIAVPRDAQDLVIVLRLAPLQRGLRLLQLVAQCADLGVRRGAFRLRLLDRGLEVRDGGVVLLEVQLDARACAQRFEGVRRELEGDVGIGERVFLAVELC
jgi:hypothetical protein